MKQDGEPPSSPPSRNFLDGGGTMGALIRAHDWSSTLGQPESWPQALRTVIRLMLTTQHPMFVFWGPDHICLYNDAYISFIGPEQHPRMLGAPGKQMWENIWDVIGPQIELVMRGDGATWHQDHCIPLFRHGALDEAYFTYGYSPIDDENARNGVGGVLVICAETTQKVLFGKHQAFRLQLEGTLRAKITAEDIVATSTRLLGEFLEASRCCYLEAEIRSEFLLVRSDWTKGTVPRLRPRIHVGELGPAFLAWHRHETTLHVEDPESEEAPGHRREFLTTRSNVPAGVAAPIVKAGRLVATLCVYPPGQFRWTEQHHVLIRDVAERIWEGVEHAHAAAERDRTSVALRNSEARYRSLVEASAAIVWEMPAAGGFATPQPGWSAYTGQSFEQLRGWGWLSAVHPDDQDRTAEIMGRAFETRSNFELRYRLRGRDGDYRSMLIRAVAITNPDGTLGGWIGVNSDLAQASC
jgi:PAS domain S-box-containing protein